MNSKYLVENPTLGFLNLVTHVTRQVRLHPLMQVLMGSRFLVPVLYCAGRQEGPPMREAPVASIH